MLAHGTQLHTAMACSADLGINRLDRALVVMPLFHVGGKVVQLSAQWQGATTVILDRFEADSYLLALQDQRVTVGHLAPAMIQNLLERSEEHTSELQSLMRISYAVFCLKKKKTQKT